jgi:hypothetical protein
MNVDVLARFARCIGRGTKEAGDMTHRSKGLLAAVTTAAVLGSVAPADAANWTCESSSLRGQVLPQLGTPVIEPITANKGQATCKTAKSPTASPLPAPLSLVLQPSVLFAETSLTGPSDNVGAQTATASGGLADVRIGLPTPQLPQLEAAINAIPAVELPLPLGALGLPLVGLPSKLSLDLKPALRALVQPNVELLRIRAGAAYAKASCVDGKLALDGSSQVAGISLLGQDLILNGALETTLNVLGGQAIDPSQLDVTKIGLPAGIAPELLPIIQGLIKPLLDTLPDIQLPASVAKVSIVPAQQDRTATTLTQHALAIKVDIAGQRLIDLDLGQASVGANSVECANVVTSAEQAALQCTSRRIVLTDVLQKGNRVRLTGAADKRFVGKTVDIHFVPPFGGGPRVAQAKVGKDGSFATTAPLPAKAIRGTNRARYQARLGKERSLRLKLKRRMVVNTVKVSGGKVRISGRVSRPLAAPTRTIEVRERISCKRWRLVRKIKPKSNGTWSTVLDAPDAQLAGTYRFTTKVRKNTKNQKTYPTFTLPRYVDLAS